MAYDASSGSGGGTGNQWYGINGSTYKNYLPGCDATGNLGAGAYNTQTNRTLFFGDGTSAISLSLGGSLYVNSGRVGLNNKVDGTNSMAIGNVDENGGGTSATGNDSISIGNDAQAAGDNSTALGTDAQALENNGTALGADAKVSIADGVAIGSKSVSDRPADVDGYVPTGARTELKAAIEATRSTLGGLSVGDPNNATLKQYRQITGVAAGTEDSDAVNVAQLTAAQTHYYSVNDNGVVGGNYANDGAAGLGALAAGIAAGATGDNATAVGASASANADAATAIGYQAMALVTNSIALGSGAKASVTDGVALGADSAADTAAGVAGYDPLTKLASTDTSATWKSTQGAVSVGDVATGKTRQINSVAAGTADTDAVNVAQLKKSISGSATHYYSVNDGGTVGGNYNNDGATGANALAAGVKAVASSQKSIAIGYDAQATGTTGDAIAIGSGSRTTGDQAVGIGKGASAGGGSAVAIGSAATATGGSNVAIGNNAKAEGGSWATAVGFGAKTSDVAAAALGYNAQAGYYGTALGAIAVAGNNATAVGTKTTASGSTSLAAGYSANSSGQYSTAVGPYAKASGQGSTALGGDYNLGASAVSANSVALGSGSVANVNKNIVGVDPRTGLASTSVTSVWKSTTGAVSVGDVANGVTRQIVSVAAGTADSDAVNVAQLKSATTHYYSVKDNGTTGGNYANDGATGSGALAAGFSSAAAGTQSTAVGYNNNASGDSSVAVGSRNLATADGAIAIGNQTKATAANTVAIGTFAQVDNAYGVAIGYQAATSTGSAGVAVGDQSKATGTGAAALGYGAKANGDNSTALGAGTNATEYSTAVGISSVAQKSSLAAGYFASATGNNSAALGYRANALGDFSVALGTHANASAADSVALGRYAVANTAAGVAGYDPVTQAASTQTSATWKSTLGAVSVGDLANYRTRQITGVAAGALDTDAVNVAQLKGVQDLATAGWNVSDADGNSANIGPNGKVTFNGDSNIDVAQSGADQDGKIAVTLNRDLDLDSVTLGDTLIDTTGLTIAGGPSITTSGIDAGGLVISNVAPGVAGTDAVNVDQLKDLADTPLTFTGNSGSVERKLGDTLTITGEAGTTGDYSGANLKTVVDPATGVISLQMAESPKFGNVTINAADSGKITGLTAGTDDTDAVNVSQLTEVKDLASAGWNVSDADGNSANIGPNGKVIFSGDSNIDVAQNGADQDGQVAVTLNRDLDLDSVTLGDTLIDTTGLTIAGGPSITTSGIDAGGLVISNVAPGVAGTDAVNVDQLNETNANITNIYETGTKYFHANSTGADSIASGIDSVAIGMGAVSSHDGSVALGAGSLADGSTLEHEAYLVGGTATGEVSIGDRRITGLSAGADDTDAVNVGQLKAVTSASVADAVMYDDSTHNSVTLGGDTYNSVTKTGGTRIRNVAAGVDGGDAVNVDQLNAQGDELTAKGLDFADTAGNILHRDLGELLTISGEGSTAGDYSGANLQTVIDPLTGTLSLQMAESPKFGNVTINDGGSGKITGLTAGTDGTDAVNVDQLTALADQAVQYDLNGDGTVNYNSVTLAGDTYDTVTKTGGTRIRNVAAGVDGGDAVNVDQLTDMGDDLTAKGLKFDGNEGGIVHRDLGETLVITGEASTAGDYSGANLKTVTDPLTGAISLQMAEAPKFGNVTLNDGGSGKITGLTAGTDDTDAVNVSQLTAATADAVMYDDSTHNSVTLGGDTYNSVTRTGGTRIRNVAAGEDGGDAVNVDQLNDVKDLASAGWNVSDVDGSSANIGPNGKVTFTGDSNIGVAQSGADQDGKIAVTLNRDLDVDSVTLGDTLINNAGLTINNGPSITVGGIDMHNTRITNLAKGEDGGDAVNLDQLNEMGDGLTTKGLKFAGNEGDTVHRNLGETLAISGEASAAGSYSGANLKTVTDPLTGTIHLQMAESPKFGNVTLNDGGSGKITGLTAGEDDTDAVNVSQLTAATADAVMYDDSTHNSVTLGGDTYDSVTKTGGTKITNVARGEDDSDAVNKSQLNETNANVTHLGDTITHIAGDTSTTYTDVHGMGIRYVRTNEAGLVESDSSAEGQGSTAVGYNAISMGESSLALGREAQANNTGDVALGAGSVTDAAVGTAGVTIAGTDYDFAGTSPTSTVSVGSVGNERTLTNVAAGRLSATSTDAVNGSQLYATNQAVEDLSTQVVNIHDNGVKYFHANSTKADSTASGANSVVAGPAAVASGASSVAMGDEAQATADKATAVGANATASGTGASAFGNNAKAEGNGSLAMGDGARATKEKSTAIGSGAEATARNAVALGADSVADRDDSVSVGSKGKERQITNVKAGTADTDAVNVAQLKGVDQKITNVAGDVTDVKNDVKNIDNRVTKVENGEAGMFQVNQTSKPVAPKPTGVDAVAGGSGAEASGKNSVAIGTKSRSSGENSVAMGNGSSATAKNSVALGTNSVADRENSVSVGSAGNERQITNVRAGTADTDAVNLSQLNKSVGDVLNNANAYTDARYSDLKHDIAEQDNTLSAGIAGAMAMASLPQPYEPGASMAAVGVSGYRGQSALSVGVSRISDNGKWVTKLQGSADSQGEVGVGVGVGYQW
ncbi:Autotransporter adhesin [Pseudomonas jinjuensis]|uniref:Autotransporter adhesin n=1 Tax=Pseudomonas jinjuensis TaxID=198616 RepID=A0A1H0E6S6_9PSED|nr:Autotransporter adhesin [Pseudomonas jinjuensis]